MSTKKIADQRHRDAADSLHHAANSHEAVAPLRDKYKDFTVDDAYLVQSLNVERAVKSGQRIVGRKVGLTSKAVQSQLGVDQPDFGTLTDAMAYGDTEEIPWSVLMQPKAEAEIALVLERDLKSERTTMADVISAAAYALPAIEIVGSRIANWNIKFIDTVADNASSGAFVIGGTPKKIGDFDARMCGMVLERKGEPVSVGAGAACLGHPWLAAAWLASELAKRGAPLKAGDIVLTGALGPMVAVAPGEILEARIEGLGSVRARFGGRS